MPDQTCTGAHDVRQNQAGGRSVYKRAQGHVDSICWELAVGQVIGDIPDPWELRVDPLDPPRRPLLRGWKLPCSAAAAHLAAAAVVIGRAALRPPGTT